MVMLEAHNDLFEEEGEKIEKRIQRMERGARNCGKKPAKGGGREKGGKEKKRERTIEIYELEYKVILLCVL